MANREVDIRSFISAIDRHISGGRRSRSIISNETPFVYDALCLGAVPVRIALDQEADIVSLGSPMYSGYVYDLTSQIGVLRATTADLETALQWANDWASQQLLPEYLSMYGEFASEWSNPRIENDDSEPAAVNTNVRYRPDGAPSVTLALPIFHKVFGPHGRIDSFNSNDNTVRAVLYETFAIRFGYIDGRYRYFGCGIAAGPRSAAPGFGPPILPELPYREDIEIAFEGADRWCRAVLPADYLAAMVEAYGPLRELPDLSVASDGTTDTEETPS